MHIFLKDTFPSKEGTRDENRDRDVEAGDTVRCFSPGVPGGSALWPLPLDSLFRDGNWCKEPRGAVCAVAPLRDSLLSFLSIYKVVPSS